jgi:hypothetical protein
MKLCALLGLIAMFCGSAIAQPEAPAIPDEVTAWLKSYVASRTNFDGGPVPYPESPTLVEGQLGTGSAAALLFTLGAIRGGTDYLQYLAVFRKHSGHYVFCCSRRVGGKGIGSVESVTIQGSVIRLSGNQFVPGADAMCCPSKPYVRDMSVRGSKVVDAAPASNNRWSGP